MTNTLYLPELREMLAEQDAAQLVEFCTALHPARTAEFMEGLTASEAWKVLQHADLATRVAIFTYFERAKQVAVVETSDRAEIGSLITHLPSDDRVDILHDVSPETVNELMPLIPVEERRDIQRLREFPEDTAGAAMTTDFVRLAEHYTVRQALDALARQVASLEMVYYLYVVDQEDHLRGVVSARQLLVAMGRPETLISSLMERAVVCVQANDKRAEVVNKVARFDFLAIPVVDEQSHMLGIITHDDVIDLVQKAATEEAQRMAAVEPLEEGYLQTAVLTLFWKRGVWLLILFFGGLLAAGTLGRYAGMLEDVTWLVFFIPLVMSSGGNSGNQTATLIITAMSKGDVSLADWSQIIRREIQTGLLLGTLLGAVGYAAALCMGTGLKDALVLPISLILVVTWGTLAGSALPLIFRRMGLDPALMSNPAVASMTDIVSIVVYMTLALWMLST